MTAPNADQPRLRVLHVAQPVEAGVPVVVDQLVRDQLRRGWQVAVACPPDGSLPRWAQAAGAPLLPWQASRSPGASVPGEVASLRRLVADYAPDLVHLHSSKAGLAGRLAIRGRRATVYQPHAWSFLAVEGAVHNLSLRWERYATRWTSAIICVSRAEQETGERSGLAARWALCPNGVDLEAFRPSTAAERDAAREGLGLSGREVVLCVGRLCRQKGQDVLLEAWRQLDTHGAVLALVGDGPDREALERHAGPDVVFAGHVDDARPWYAAAGLVVQPSRWEGASLTTREAMACGLSQVVTDVDGAREALGDCGALVPVEDPGPLAAAIRRRLDDAQLRESEGACARRGAERSFDLTRTLDAIAATYGSVLAVRR